MSIKRNNITGHFSSPSPLLFNGKKLKVDERLVLLNEKSKQGRREQISGLIYNQTQMPTDTNNRGWNNVYRIPIDQMEKISYSIKTPDGNIHIDYPAGSPPLCIQKFVNHLLFNHSKVRNISGEKGLMVGGGKRYDKTSATVIDYVPAINNNSTTSGQTNSLLYEASLAFDNICCNSSVSHSYRNEIKVLSKMNNVTTMKCTKVSSTDNNSTKITVHPTYSITRNITNALHYDINDDSRSFAIWYTTSDNKRSKSWLLFPDYGIAIEIGKYILISWDSRVMKHCTCSCDENVEDTPIYSFFASSNKLVSFYYKIETAFKKRDITRVCVRVIKYM